MTDVLMEPLAPTHEDDSRRFFRLRDVEWRDSGNGKEYTFVGTATVFGSWSESLWTPRGNFKERFLPGAFEEVFAGPHDVRFLKNHDKNLVLARTKSGTLELEETDSALRVWARVARTTYATDLKLSMERGDIDQMSLQFEMDYDRGAEDRWYEDPRTGEICHDVIKVSDLFDVSVVTFPAYAETSAAMRDFSRAQARGRVPMQSKAQTSDLSPRAYQRCRQVVAETPWAIHPPYLNLIMSILDERSMGYRPSDQEIKDRIGVKRDATPTEGGTTAVIPLVGPVMTRAGAMSDVSGASTLEEFKSAFRQALNDPAVQAIVLDIDSPGGTVDGVPEMAAEIAAARGTKPITAVANYMAASAAYWIATAADELVVSPSAEVGSVGVYAAHQDRSAEMASKGINTTFVYAGDHKVDGNPFQPLSEEAQAHLQEQIDSIYEDFVDAVAANRGTTTEDVLANFGQGRTLLAREAVAAGMADRVATLDEVLQEKSSPIETRSFVHNIPEPINFSISTISGIETMPGSGSSANVNYTYQLETRDHVREVLGLVAQAETDPVDDRIDAALPDAEEEIPPVISGNVVVEADGLAALKKRSAAAAQRARDDKVRLTKEMLQ